MDDYKITEVNGIEILDSRGNPTVRACVRTPAIMACADAPAGASRGKHEAVELRDGGERVGGKGVRKAVFTIENIVAQAIIGMDVRDQELIDKTLIKLDGTPNKSKLGGNVTVSVSLAVARAASGLMELPLYRYIGGLRRYLMPVPFMNIINGGKHAANQLSIQEFMIVPAGAKTFSDALWMAVEVYHELRRLLKKEIGGYAVGLGDEGGFAPPFQKTDEALGYLEKAVTSAGWEAGEDIVFAIDSAASNFYEEKTGKYKIDGKSLDGGELLEYYMDLVERYPIKSIEDPFYEEEFGLFHELSLKMRGKRGIVVGDDLLTTNIERLKKALEENAVTAVLVKPNQIGTLTETIEFTQTAISKGLKALVSHRSGDTEDDFIADLAVGLSTGAIKTGAPARGERTSKYNRLLEIERLLGDTALYPGMGFFM